ncbi:MAG: SpoVA/SpoVAEb family sporulation membrane protein [Clostridia bacterium]|nr:SpoVA/SpoVAEb family sporulation membrane protein [Clostridia bacterium]
MDYLKAFVFGGLICVVGQILIDKTKLTPARILVLFVTAGAALELFGIYRHFTDFAGEGAAIPLSGFGAVLVKGVKAAVDEKGLFGIITGGVTAAASGITAALAAGLIVSAVFSSKPRK